MTHHLAAPPPRDSAYRNFSTTRAPALKTPLKWLSWLLQTIRRTPRIPLLHEVTLEAGHLALLNGIAYWRKSCIGLALEIRLKSEKHFARFPESTRERIVEILDALSTSEFSTTGSSDSSEQLQRRLRSSDVIEAPAISKALTQWRNDLREQNEMLLRLQRYVSLAISKLPVQGAVTPEQVYSKSELAIAQKLNMEIAACELLLGREEVASLPSNVQIEPTDRCNARCKSCSHRSPVGWSYHDMEISTLEKLHHVLSTAQFVEIFGLGEPTISPSFGHIAELCSFGASQTHVITNGTMLTANPALGKLSKIGISFDGATKETFETLRVGINFEKLLADIRVFRKQNPATFIYLTATINRANIQEIPMMAKLCRDLDLQAICFHRMSTGVKELLPALLTTNDIVNYRSKIEQAKVELEGSNVKLFDYLIAEQLSSSEEPLNPEQSLVTIKSFVAKTEKFSSDLSQVIQELKKQTIPYPLSDSTIQLISVVRPHVLTDDAKNITSKEETHIDRSLKEVEKRAAALKEEVRAVGTAGLKIPYCLAAWYRLYLKADGLLDPCCSWRRGYSNINEVQTFNDSWNGPFQRNLRRGFHGEADLANACRDCISIDRYQGMTELLLFLKSLGISYEEVPKHAGFNPPPGKLQI